MALHGTVQSQRSLLERFRPSPANAGMPGLLSSLQAYGGLRAWAARSHRPAESLGRIGSLEVRLAQTAAEVRQAQKLRYKVFYQEGPAAPNPARLLARRDLVADIHGGSGIVADEDHREARLDAAGRERGGAFGEFAANAGGKGVAVEDAGGHGLGPGKSWGFYRRIRELCEITGTRKGGSAEIGANDDRHTDPPCPQRPRGAAGTSGHSPWSGCR